MNPFEFTDWPCPAPGGGTREEMALAFDRNRDRRLLVLPAWFDEANKLRRQTVEIMRRLDLSGIDSVLPDLPGTNESEAPLAEQTLDGWRRAGAAAASHFRITHVLTWRAGALLAPEGVPGWQYAAIGGKQVLRAMLRARSLSSREAGRTERSDELQSLGREHGIELAGWQLGPALFAALERAEPSAGLTEIGQSDVGGPALWLRAEPDEDPHQADAIAAMLAFGMAGE
ncbi:hypothetical protein ACWPM1_08895 [Tsuneonella sp. HG249]